MSKKKKQNEAWELRHHVSAHAYDDVTVEHKTYYDIANITGVETPSAIPATAWRGGLREAMSGIWGLTLQGEDFFRDQNKKL